MAAAVNLTRRLVMPERFGVAPYEQLVPDVTLAALDGDKPAKLTALHFHADSEMFVFVVNDTDRIELARLLSGGVQIAKPTDLRSLKTGNGPAR